MLLTVEVGDGDPLEPFILSIVGWSGGDPRDPAV